MTIAILGAGSVGQALAGRFKAAGRSYLYGARDTAEREELAPHSAPAKEAVARAGMVLLAVQYPKAEAALKGAGDLTGKIVIDATNPLQMTDDWLALSVGHTSSGAEDLARRFPEARFVKCFNQTGAENLADPGRLEARPAMFVAGDDEDARAQVRDLAEACGFEAIDAGPLKTARLLEPLAMLWIEQALKRGQGRDFAFALTRAK